MNTPSRSPEVDVEAAVRALHDGFLAILPTETVYGLAADARQPHAVSRIFTVKGRPADHPLIVHLGATADLADWARDIPDSAYQLAEAFWPGPLTLVLLRHPETSLVVTGGLDTVALRVPAHPMALAVIEGLRRNDSWVGARAPGIAAPSANRFGRVSPTTAAHASADLAAYLQPGDVVLDGGPCRFGLESTIVDLATQGPTTQGPTTHPTVLRPGAITTAQLSHVLGVPVDVHQKGPSRAPGMLAAHYAPDARVEVVESARLADRIDAARAARQRVAVLGPRDLVERHAAVVTILSAPEPYDGSAVANILYARLHEADEMAADVLLVVPPNGSSAPGSVAAAVLDRLRRAEVGSREPTMPAGM